MPTNTNMAEKESPVDCPQCNKAFTTDENAVGCDGNCKKWFHKTCAQLSTAEFNALSGRKGNLLWMCPSCRNLLAAHGINTSTPQDEKVKQAMIETRTSQEEIKTQIEELSNSLQQKMSLVLEAQIQQADILSKIQEANNNTAVTLSAQSDDTCNTLEETEVKTTYRDSVIRERNQTPHLNTPQTQNGANTELSSMIDTTLNPSTKPLQAAIVRGNVPQNTFDIRAAPRREWLFIGNLDANTTKEHITDHCRGRGITNIACEALDTRTTKAFKVGVLAEELHLLKKPESWPIDVVVKPFRFGRPKRARNTYNNDFDMEYRRN